MKKMFRIAIIALAAIALLGSLKNVISSNTTANNPDVVLIDFDNSGDPDYVLR
jgi:anti-sigma-K factor RskA